MQKRRLLFITFITAVLIMAFGVLTCSAASQGVCGDNVKWTLDDKGVLTISGEGSISYGSSESQFYGNKEIKTVVIQSGVTDIGQYAFFNCPKLTSVRMADSVKSIGYGAFYNCTSLKSIEIPDGVTSIGEYAFASCISLNNVTIPGSVESIGSSAFSSCQRLTDITVSDGVKRIESSAFSGCDKLAGIDIPGSVEEIGMQAFSGCTGLKELTISEGVENIGDYAFSQCRSLESVKIPGSVKSIGIQSFLYCYDLQSVTMDEGVTSIGDNAFSGCRSMTDLTIPDSVTGIGSGTFSDCEMLNSVTMGEGVTSIGDYAFNGCRSMTDFTIPDSVASIGRGAFGGCKMLKSVTIPGGVKSIGDFAFSGCESLEDVYYGYTSNRWKVLISGIVDDNLRNARIHFGRPELKKAAISGTKVTLTWTDAKHAASYDVYRGESENGKYKKIASVGKATTYSQTISRGKTYYYKIKANYPDGDSDYSNALSQYAVKKTKAKRLSRNKLKYNSWYSLSEGSYLFSDGSRLYSVGMSSERKLRVCTLDSKFNVSKTKTLTMPAKSTFCGFFHGIDGNNYVAVCFSNPKESKTKTVIQIIKYSSKWKKLKVAYIKGGVSNAFVGIYGPVASGNLRMDMQGHTLYVHTSRTMFMLEDGLHHQSNIEFAVNTKTMKAVSTEDSYVSHSFDQYVRFKDGELYLMDLGDAYPRELTVKRITNYGWGDDFEKNSSYTLFEFMGETGDNYTGTAAGGMEIGAHNIIAVGTSVPHNRPVNGVTGFNGGWNLYAIVTDRETGKTVHKWLTKYDPSKSTGVEYARLVKLSDYRFAVLCTIKGRLHYYAIDNNGNIKVHKKYPKKYAFTSSTQPVLYKGSIIWTEETFSKKTTHRLYSIPAL